VVSVEVQYALNVLQDETQQGVGAVARSKALNEIDDSPKDLGAGILAPSTPPHAGPGWAWRTSNQQIDRGEFLKRNVQQVARFAPIPMAWRRVPKSATEGMAEAGCVGRKVY
jgi:hypothetical protein